MSWLYDSPHERQILRFLWSIGYKIVLENHKRENNLSAIEMNPVTRHTKVLCYPDCVMTTYTCFIYCPMPRNANNGILYQVIL